MPYGTRKQMALTACLCGLLLSSVAQADVRSEAIAMLAKLRSDGVAERFPQELRSLDATVATAEMYYQLSDSQNAERYYRLATQKGTQLRERLIAPSQPAPVELEMMESSTGRQRTSSFRMDGKLVTVLNGSPLLDVCRFTQQRNRLRGSGTAWLPGWRHSACASKL